MNITQIMNLYSWGDKAGFERRPNADFDPTFQLALSKTVGEYGTMLDIDGAPETFVVFNHATSEVLLFVLHDYTADVVTVYSNGPSAVLDWCLENYDYPVVVDGDTILSMIAKSVGKEDDVEMNFDIDTETLARLDQLAAQSNLTRSGIITKALIDTIIADDAAKDEPIVVGFNYILTAIRNCVPVQFYNTTVDCWVDLRGASAEIRERTYDTISHHFENMDWRIKPATTT